MVIKTKEIKSDGINESLLTVPILKYGGCNTHDKVAKTTYVTGVVIFSLFESVKN